MRDEQFVTDFSSRRQKGRKERGKGMRKKKRKRSKIMVNKKF